MFREMPETTMKCHGRDGSSPTAGSAVAKSRSPGEYIIHAHSCGHGLPPNSVRPQHKLRPHLLATVNHNSVNVVNPPSDVFRHVPHCRCCRQNMGTNPQRQPTARGRSLAVSSTMLVRVHSLLRE